MESNEIRFVHQQRIENLASFAIASSVMSWYDFKKLKMFSNPYCCCKNNKISRTKKSINTTANWHYHAAVLQFIGAQKKLRFKAKRIVMAVPNF